jgi:hypothetical protein
MRCRYLPWIHRRASRGLLILALLTATVPRPAFADDALLVEQTSPAAPAPSSANPGPSAGKLESSAEYVEDPTRMAGGEDDAMRANERQVERQQDDDGDKRRK